MIDVRLPSAGFAGAAAAACAAAALSAARCLFQLKAIFETAGFRARKKRKEKKESYFRPERKREI